MTVRVEQVLVADQSVLVAMNALVPQLSRTAPSLAMADLEQMVSSDAVSLLVAREGDEIVGTLTLVIFRIPSGVRAWIEDVIVDEDQRGQGVGEALTHEAVYRARAAGATTLDLTSRPSRESANRLYQRLGFESRETNVYRFSVESLGDASQ